MRNKKVSVHVTTFMLAGALLLVGPAALFGQSVIPPQEEIRAAFVTGGPIGDYGYNYAHELGRLEMAKLPYVTKTTIVEDVPAADAYRVLTGLARQGYNLIIPVHFGHMEAAAEVADMFPNIAFENATGYMLRKNLGNYIPMQWNAYHLIGLLAGKMTERNSVGIVASVPIADLLRSVNAIVLGVQESNPKAEVRVIFVGSFYDPAAEREAAESLVAAGADMICQVIDSPATQYVAEKAGIYSTGAYSDMRKFAPNANLTSVKWQMGVYYNYFAQQLHEGKWKSESLFWGMKEGTVDLAPFNSVVPVDVQNYINATKQRIIDGDITAMAFYGPIWDQSGKLQIPAGELASHEHLMGMNYLVRGAIGTVPK